MFLLKQPISDKLEIPFPIISCFLFQLNFIFLNEDFCSPYPFTSDLNYKQIQIMIARLLRISNVH